MSHQFCEASLNALHLLTRVAPHFKYSYSQQQKNAMGLTTTLLKVRKQSWRNMSNLRWGPGSRGMRNISLFMFRVPGITGSSLLHADAVPVRTWEEWGKVPVLILIQRGFPLKTIFQARGLRLCDALPPLPALPAGNSLILGSGQGIPGTQRCVLARRHPKTWIGGWPGDSELHDRQWSSQLLSFLEVSEQGHLLRRMDVQVLWPPVTSVLSLRLRKGIGCPCNDRH